MCNATISITLQLIQINAHKKEIQWQKSYSSASEFTDQLVQDAQTVWFYQIRAMTWLGYCMLGWTIFAMLMFIAYTGVAYRLLSIVGGELKKSKRGEVRREAARRPPRPGARAVKYQ